ncbi:hypothetical protein MMC13_001389 [Lambiella insularis]|nr:hypothetical protein [Lambiella insularis]
METTVSDVEQGTFVASEADWDEARINSSLAHLQEMHIQLRQLRETIPSLMQTIHSDYRSPEDLYAAISQAAVAAVSGIKGFATLVREAKSQEILVKASESRVKNNEGVVDWLVTQHPDWLDRTVEEGVKQLRLDEDGQESDIAGQVGQEDVTTVQNKFRDEHPGIDVSHDQGANTLNLHLPLPASIHFQIHLQANPQNAGTYIVTCQESSHLHAGILRAVAKRPRADDLRYLLVRIENHR